MKILFINRSLNDYAMGRFKQEAERKSLDLEIFNYAHLKFNLKPGKIDISTISGESVDDFDLIITRSPGMDRRYVWQERVLVKYLTDQKRLVLNSESMLKFQGDFDKLIQEYIFYQHKLPFVSTINYGCVKMFPHHFRYPFAFKRIFGSLGRDFKLIRSEARLQSFLKKHHPYEYLKQPFLRTGFDFRIITLGEKVLGVMRRTAAKGQIVTNVAQGGAARKDRLTKELKTLALKAARVVGCDFAGVDIMYSKFKKPHILEVNRYPVFKGFESSTGINVAGRVIDFMLDKYRAKKRKKIKRIAPVQPAFPSKKQK